MSHCLAGHFLRSYIALLTDWLWSLFDLPGGAWLGSQTEDWWWGELPESLKFMSARLKRRLFWFFLTSTNGGRRSSEHIRPRLISYCHMPLWDKGHLRFHTKEPLFLSVQMRWLWFLKQRSLHCCWVASSQSVWEEYYHYYCYYR